MGRNLRCTNNVPFRPKRHSRPGSTFTTQTNNNIYFASPIDAPNKNVQRKGGATKNLVRIPCCKQNRLLDHTEWKQKFDFYTKTTCLLFKPQINLHRHDLRPEPNICHLPPFSLFITFKKPYFHRHRVVPFKRNNYD
jgi:hypothetical protein